MITRTFTLTLMIMFILSMPVSLYATEVLQLSLEPYEKKYMRTGQLSFYRTYQYSFKSSGDLKQLRVDVGDQFKKGDLLAAVDTDDLSSELNQLLAEKAFVNQEVRRLRELEKLDAVSARDVEKYRSRSSQLKAQIIRVREYLDASTIIAPYDGVVLSRNVDLGEFIAPGQSVLAVAPIESNLVISLAVAEHELGQLEYGKELVVRDKSGQRSLLATVKKIATTPSSMTGLFQVDLAIKPFSNITIGKLFDVEVSQQTGLVFKVPNHLANVDFNKTAVINIVDQDSKPRLKRFNVVDFDLDHIYVDAQQLTQLTIIK